MPYKIKELREKHNMSQTELCKRAKISRQKLFELENGKESNTTILTLKKIANVFKCKVTDLFCH